MVARNGGEKWWRETVARNGGEKWWRETVRVWRSDYMILLDDDELIGTNFLDEPTLGLL